MKKDLEKEDGQQWYFRDPNLWHLNPDKKEKSLNKEANFNVFEKEKDYYTRQTRIARIRYVRK